MRSLQFENGILSLRDVEEPTPNSKEALIDVTEAGICGTDLSIVSGDYKLKSSKPVTLGHEIVGKLRNEQKLTGEILSPGTRVVTEINVSCGRCYLCHNGLRTHCSNIQTIGIDRDGGFAEMVSVPVDNLKRVPDEVSDDEAVFTEPLAAAIQLTKLCPIDEGASVAVVGCGRLGLLALQVLKLARPETIVAIGRKTGRKLDLARKLGADMAYATDENESSTLIKSSPGYVGFDHVLETSGSTTGMALALDIVRPRGTIHAKSTHGISISFDLTKAVVKEIRIQGSRCGPFGDALLLLKDKRVSVKEMISARFALETFDEAFAVSRNHDSIKALFTLS